MSSLLAHQMIAPPAPSLLHLPSLTDSLSGNWTIQMSGFIDIAPPLVSLCPSVYATATRPSLYHPTYLLHCMLTQFNLLLCLMLTPPLAYCSHLMLCMVSMWRFCMTTPLQYHPQLNCCLYPPLLCQPMQPNSPHAASTAHKPTSCQGIYTRSSLLIVHIWEFPPDGIILS